jgi:hypothetical protein
LKKTCPRCKEEKELKVGGWSRNKSTRSGWGFYCLSCHNSVGKAFLVSKGGVRDYKLRARYGVTAAQVDQMIKDQGGLCAICGDLLELEKHTAHQDHNHKTNKPRGILCSSCNQGLGNFKDDIDRLEAAIKYLLTWKGGE